jgi:hypothetical protein
MPGYDPEEPCVPLSAISWPKDGGPLIDPECRTETVLAIAREIQSNRSVDLMPILGDALEDAGCNNQFVLNHCRRCSRHKPSCWVVSAVLRKPSTSQTPANPLENAASSLKTGTTPALFPQVPESWSGPVDRRLWHLARLVMWLGIFAGILILGGAALTGLVAVVHYWFGD